MALIVISCGSLLSSLAFAALPTHSNILPPALYCLASFTGGLYCFLNTTFTAIADHTQHLSTESRSAIFGQVEAAAWFGISLGPTIGGILTEKLGFRWAFIASAISCALLLLLLLTVVPETLQV